MYSIVLAMAMTSGGDVADLGRHNSCCGEEARCGRRHHGRRGGDCGCEEPCGAALCSTCSNNYAPCGSCYSAAPAGCPTCSNGVCALALAQPDAATIVVLLPADATLTVDDAPTTSTSDHRVFVTPSLPSGQDFHYTLKAEINVNGKPTVVTQVVKVRAGETSNVTLSAPTSVAER